MLLDHLASAGIDPMRVRCVQMLSCLHVCKNKHSLYSRFCCLFIQVYTFGFQDIEVLFQDSLYTWNKFGTLPALPLTGLIKCNLLNSIDQNFRRRKKINHEMIPSVKLILLS